ncbi:hypothetical protein WA026_011796 [Henosepilachna vigintioctopunctata]|uniref:Golgi apparatus membrane protein TVP23 homolog n=1 Tax=Henosepilachna vigintioctopunctata TaxID=420089 RepID=A0AAW1UMC5_9CUCU
MDFWTDKNITGRFTVGLRWWNHIDDDGKSHWVFESRNGLQQNSINDREAYMFWTALVLTPLVLNIWSILFLIAFFSFSVKWLLIVIIALVLSRFNLYGYLKCKIGSNESITNVTTIFFRNQVLKSAVAMVSSQTIPFTNKPANTI